MKSTLRSKSRKPNSKRVESGTFDESLLAVIYNVPYVLFLHFPTV